LQDIMTKNRGWKKEVNLLRDRIARNFEWQAQPKRTDKDIKAKTSIPKFGG